MTTALMALQALVVIVAAALVAAGGALAIAPRWSVLRGVAWLASSESTHAPGFALERVFYRHHRAVGMGIVLAAVYIQYFLVFHFSPAAISDLLLADLSDGAIKPVLVRLSQLLLFFGALLAFAVGLVLAVRPSALKPMETLAHQPLRVSGWLRLAERPGAARACGVSLIGLGVWLWWLAGPAI